MDLSIIIVNYNLTGEVETCIRSILGVMNNNITYEIIVVDNNSSDGKFPALINTFKSEHQIKFLSHHTNYGFGAGNNVGARIAKSKILYFLNPDTVIRKNFFSTIFNRFNSNPDIAVVGTRIENENSELEHSAGKFPTLISYFLDIFYLRFKIEKLLFIFNISRIKENNADWVSGASIFIRKTIFEEINGFDEKFFMYNEEVDLCKRVKKRGFEIMVEPSSCITHIGSVGSKKNYYFFTKVSYESKLIYVDKHFLGCRKLIAKNLVVIELLLQFIVWLALYLIYPEKASGKLRAMPDLLRKCFPLWK